MKKKYIGIILLALAFVGIGLAIRSWNNRVIQSEGDFYLGQKVVSVRISSRGPVVISVEHGGSIVPEFSNYSRWYLVYEEDKALWVYSGDVGAFLIKPNPSKGIVVETITMGSISSYRDVMPQAFRANLPEILRRYVE